MDKEVLLRARLPEDDVEIPGVGNVRVRALSRAESMQMADVKGAEAIERKMISLALVDPKLTEVEVGAWQELATSDELDLVSQKIAELSGLREEDTDKQAYKRLPGDSGAGVRVLPSGEAGDDSGETPSGDDS